MFNKELSRRLKREVGKRRKLKYEIATLKEAVKRVDKNFEILLKHLNLILITTEAKPVKRILVLRDGAAGSGGEK